MLRSGMPDLKKQEYYRKNREKRLRYQAQWYARNKQKIERADEVLQVTDHEAWEKKRKKKRDYNKRYYEKNKDRLLAKQRERYAKREPK